MRRIDTKIRVLRTVTGSLATLGLLGHGLLMLWVAVATPAAGEARAEALAFIEICTPRGIRTIAWDGAPQTGPAADRDAPEHPSPGKGHIDDCPVCTAYAKNGPADLPSVAAAKGQSFRAATWQAPPAFTAELPQHRPVQPRGPPARA